MNSYSHQCLVTRPRLKHASAKLVIEKSAWQVPHNYVNIDQYVKITLTITWSGMLLNVRPVTDGSSEHF